MGKIGDGGWDGIMTGIRTGIREVGGCWRGGWRGEGVAQGNEQEGGRRGRKCTKVAKAEEPRTWEDTSKAIQKSTLGWVPQSFIMQHRQMKERIGEVTG